MSPGLAPIYLCGPTASGKSELAAALAQRIGGEVVGMDAFQIYCGLDLLSAKPSRETMALAPHHLISEIDPALAFDVGQYFTLATARIAAIQQRGAVPIVCGGTGLYLRALTQGLAELPGADASLRERLSAQPLAELVAQLRTLDPETTVDLANPRRVLRALEVCLLTGRPFSSFRQQWGKNGTHRRGFVLSRHRETLHRNIALRTTMMFAAGVVEEVAATPRIGTTAAQMLGLREIRAYLAGQISRDACIEMITLATRQYAKRQITWFRREHANGLPILDLDTTSDALGVLVKMFGSALPEL